MNKQTLRTILLALVATLGVGTALAQTEYDLQIAGTKVNSNNCNNLSIIEGVTGTAKYDNTTRTLTLDNATIRTTAEGDNGVGIIHGIDNLKIQLIGKNTISAEGSVGMINGGICTLTGSGELIVNGSTTASKKENRLGILNRNTITVSGCTLEASGGESGLSSGYWKFDHCNVRVKGGGSSENKYVGSIDYMWDKEPEFTGCAITTPMGAYWKEFQIKGSSYYSLFGADNMVITDWVTISKGASSIGEVKANVPQKKRDIYNLEGIRLSGEWKDLPAGIYIVDGEKRIKE